MVLRLELEQGAQARVEAATYEDELRLRHWLHRSGTFKRLPANVLRYLDALDEVEHAA